MTGYDWRRRLALFPDTTRLLGEDEEQQLVIAGCDLVELASEYGTPLYVYDQATMDNAVRSYRQALSASYPEAWGITYAAKALLCLAVGQWARQRDLFIDCSSAGEISIAVAAGVGRENLVVHGVNKSQADLDATLAHAGTIVVDNLFELERLLALVDGRTEPLPDLWLRLRPGLAVATHAYRQTGQESSKFGMDAAEVARAVGLCIERGLPPTGLHFHLGSQFQDPSPVTSALAVTLDLMVALRAEYGWSPTVLCPGGGWGVAYCEEDLPQPSIDDYVTLVARQVAQGCRQRQLPLPRLQLEPGRSLVARPGVALYRVGAMKHTSGRRWLLVDGGLADNPRPALYGSCYSALPVWQPARPPAEPQWIAGPYCESGDVMIHGLSLPEMHPGELLAVPVSGAYQLSMASNYNGARRPAVVWLRGGEAYPVQLREHAEDLLRRDLPLPGSALETLAY
ncbi:MAG: diaminopimelate decarboxylase [Anaerolineae bacterium]|nr:diaminopimelate decarboxylase [Anaerolineae bacterium]